MIQDYGEYPPKIHTGTLYVNRQPEYIVEMVEESDGELQYVTVYQAHRPRLADKSDKITSVKAYDRVERQVGGFIPTTVLGKIASSAFPSKKQIKLEERPPLFMAEIVEGVDTMTGQHGVGFYEREKDEVRMSNDGIKRNHGKRTGVFISLSSITWEKVRVPNEELLEEYFARKFLYIG